MTVQQTGLEKPAASRWRTAQMASFVVLRDADRVLFVKQSYGNRNWALPGGMLDPGESAWDAAIREAREETGLEVELDGLIAVVDRGGILLFVHSGRVVGGEMSDEDGEVDELRWFTAEELDELDERIFTSAAMIARSVVLGTAGPGLPCRHVVTECDGSSVAIYGNVGD
jgi:ADP-ribose pyrophosphatase YjhB (NUDIX family)